MSRSIPGAHQPIQGLERVIGGETVQQAGDAGGALIPMLLVDHHVARGVQGLLQVSHSALNMDKKKNCTFVHL